jgi:hypothetical protein
MTKPMRSALQVSRSAVKLKALESGQSLKEQFNASDHVAKKHLEDVITLKI